MAKLLLSIFTKTRRGYDINEDKMITDKFTYLLSLHVHQDHITFGWGWYPTYRLNVKQGIKVSGLLTDLPQRYTASNRLQDFPLAKSRAILEGLQSDPLAYQSLWGDSLGNIIKRDLTDGLRLSFANGEIIFCVVIGIF